MKYVTIINGTQFEIEILSDGTLLVNGERREVDFFSLGASLYSVIMDNQSYAVVIEEKDGEYQVQMRGHLYTLEVLD